MLWQIASAKRLPRAAPCLSENPRGAADARPDGFSPQSTKRRPQKTQPSKRPLPEKTPLAAFSLAMRRLLWQVTRSAAGLDFALRPC